ncbi:MAG: metallophosphoesterase [Croceibacterium sp.]
MFQTLRNIFAKPAAAPEASVPAGQRVYAVGDVHGRLDLFDALRDLIEQDDAAQGAADTTVILLGDLVDRGADSAGVVRTARTWQQQRRVRILAGNHEEMFLRGRVELEVFRHFLRHGGKETILSFGVDPDAFTVATMEQAQALMLEAVPPEDVAFIEGFEDSIAIGDYLFVHAGVQPGVPLDEQKTSDLRWIREPFLSHPDPFGAVVVHGHSIREDAEDKGNRIGIDTGAYMTGKLTALVLEGDNRRFLEAVDLGNGSIRTSEVTG